jgi:hypothetical protein
MCQLSGTVTAPSTEAAIVTQKQRYPIALPDTHFVKCARRLGRAASQLGQGCMTIAADNPVNGFVYHAFYSEYGSVRHLRR